MAFDLEGARAAGYSDAEIVGHLAKSRGFDAEGARKAGYDDKELLAHLTSTPATTNPTEYQPENPTGFAPVGDASNGASTREAVGRIGTAAADAWRNTPPIFTPEMQAVMDQGPLGQQLWNPLAKVAGGVMGGVNALGAGLSAVVGETATAAGAPSLGRDLNIAGQVVPIVMAGAPGMPLTRAGLAQREAAVPVPREPQFVTAPELPRQPAPAFIPPDANLPPPRPIPPPPEPVRPAFIPPERPPADAHLPPAAVVAPVGTDQQWLTSLRSDIQQVMQENGVNDLSAATTPEAQAKMTPAQMKANRRMAELKEVLSPPAAGEDNIIHIPGSEPTLAERAGDPVKSQLETVLRQRKPDDFEPRLSANSEARVKAFDDKAGTDPQLVTLDEMQTKVAKEDTARIMRTAKDADLQPAEDYINGLLNDPRIQEREDVMKVLKPLRDSLYDADGNLKTNPQAVWGMHDNLMNKLAKAKDPLNATGSEKFAFTQLNGFKKVVDGVMNTATDGNFQTFLDNQASFFQQKNAMEVLQKFRAGLVNPKTGHIYADKFHRWLVDLAVRRGKPGVDAAMDIPDATMRTLMDIDNDLKRSSRIDLGKARGSPTNLFFEVAKAAGLAGAHTIAGLTTGGVGNFVIQQAIPGVTNWRLNRLAQQHLAPPPEGFRPNPLGPE